jgi:hypothetical protein
MFLGIPTEVWTPAGLLGVVFIMTMRGALVPKRYYNEKIAEATRWQLAFEKQRERADKSDAQAEQLLEQGKATHALITAIFNNSTAIRTAGEQNVVS